MGQEEAMAAAHAVFATLAVLAALAVVSTESGEVAGLDDIDFREELKEFLRQGGDLHGALDKVVARRPDLGESESVKACTSSKAKLSSNSRRRRRRRRWNMPPATPLKADVIGKLAYGSWH